MGYDKRVGEHNIYEIAELRTPTHLFFSFEISVFTHKVFFVVVVVVL